jgi:hypothetical protein
LNYNKNLIIHLSYLCANKIIFAIEQNLRGTLKIFKKCGVKINLLIDYGSIINGYAGHELKIDEVYTGRKLYESEKIIVII